MFRLCVPTPLLPCSCPLISSVDLRRLLISPHLYPSPLLPPVVCRHSQRGQARSASRERRWPYAIDPGDQGAVGNRICLPPGLVRLRQPAESSAEGGGWESRISRRSPAPGTPRDKVESRLAAEGLGSVEVPSSRADAHSGAK